MKNKVYADADAALFDLFDGARVMSAGFGLSGNAENCIAAIARSQKRDLTIISNNWRAALASLAKPRSKGA